MARRQLQQDRRSDVVGQVAHNAQAFARGGGNFSEIETEHVLLGDRDFFRRKLRAQQDGEFVVKLHRDHAVRS